MLVEINWLVDTGWTVVDAKDVSRVEFKSARDGRDRASDWAGLVAWRGDPHRHPVPYTCAFNFTLVSRAPVYHKYQHISLHRKIPSVQHGSSQTYHQGD